MESDHCCLTVNDYIEFSDGIRRPYVALPSDFDIESRIACDELSQRMDTFKESGDVQNIVNGEMNQPIPMKSISQIQSNHNGERIEILFGSTPSTVQASSQTHPITQESNRNQFNTGTDIKGFDNYDHRVMERASHVSNVQRNQNCDEIEILVESSSSSVQASSRTLPPGKMYHVFFSHCTEDREWVLRMVNRLESSAYGFKCCFADRDFELGVPVFQNITKCIHSSKRTVIVLSPEFLESPWCSYETRITLELDLDARQRLLIPVMLRSCRIPDFIGRLSYIEVQNEHFWERFVAALNDNDTSLMMNEPIGSRAIMSCDPFQFNPNFFSTQDVSEVTVYAPLNCNGVQYSQFMPDELMQRGLQLNMEEYREIVRVISRLCYIRNHGCSSGLCFFLLFFFCMQIFLSLFLSQNTVFPTNSPSGIVLNVFLFFISLILILLARLTCLSKAMWSLSKATEHANKIAFQRNIMVCVKKYSRWHTCDRVTIVFKYYEWRPCLLNLKRFLLERQPLTASIEEISNADSSQDCELMIEEEDALSPGSSEIEYMAQQKLIQHATQYGQLLMEGRIATPSEQRHTRQGECLCQFVEDLLLSGKTSCLDRIFRSQSRHPWRRFLKF